MANAIFCEQQAGYGPPAPVEIFQWEAEFDRLLDIYRERSPRSVLEIGTYHGGTLYHWLQHAAPNAVVVSVDSYAVGVDNRHLYHEWVPEDVTLHVIEGDSADPSTFGAAQKFAPYDWIFIDAGHYYHEVHADWEMYRQLAAEHAVVVFHDILPPSEVWPSIEVEKLWREIQREGYLTREIVADENAQWGGIGICHLP